MGKGSKTLHIAFWKEVTNQFEAKTRILEDRCNITKEHGTVYLAYIMACWCIKFHIKYTVREWYDKDKKPFHMSIVINHYVMTTKPKKTNSGEWHSADLGYWSPRKIYQYFRYLDKAGAYRMHSLDKKIVRKEIAESWTSGRLELSYPFLKKYRRG